MNKQSGFGLIETFLIILIVLVVGFGGYTVWHNHHKAIPAAPKATQTTTSTSTLQPFIDALKRANNTQNTDDLLASDIQIKASPTPGYQTATVHINGPGVDFFYSKDEGKTWTYLTHTSDALSCSLFDNADKKAAYKGAPCVDTSKPDAPESSVK